MSIVKGLAGIEVDKTSVSDIDGAAGQLRYRGYPLEALIDLPFADVAALEWAWHHAFHAAEHVPFDLARLADVPPVQHAALARTASRAQRLVSAVAWGSLPRV